MFSTPWLMFVDTVRVLVLTVQAATGSLLFWWILTTPVLRTNKPWMAASIALMLTGYGIAYTEWDRLGMAVGSHGRLWAFAAGAVARIAFLVYSNKLRRTERGTLFEKLQWEKEREAFLAEHPELGSQNGRDR